MAPPGSLRPQLQKGKRPAAQPHRPDYSTGKRRQTLPRAAALRTGEARAEPEEHSHFQPAVEDSGKAYGEIAYAKSWCGFPHPRGQSAVYSIWREQIKSYIVARALDPSRLTESQVDSIILFARSLSPIKQRIELIQTQHLADDVGELIRHLRILVKDSAKKLQTSNERQMAERAAGGEGAKPLMAQTDWASPYCPRAVRIHVVRRTGAPEAGHPFLGHPWCASDSDRGIAWGVLATPSMKNLLRAVRGQRVEEEIGFPRYLIGATGEGAVSLRQAPEEPLPLRQLIFLNEDVDIRAWLLANKGQDPLDLMVLESRHDQFDEGDQTPEPAHGRYPFLNRKLWEDTVEAMEEEEETEWLEAEETGESQAPPGAGVIVVDDDDYEEPGTQGSSTQGRNIQRQVAEPAPSNPFAANDDQEPDAPGPSMRRRDIPPRMYEPASVDPLVPPSGESASGPTEREQFKDILDLIREKPWLAGYMTTPGLEPPRRPGHDGAQDSPPASPPVNREERPASPPAVPIAAQILTTPVGTTEQAASSTEPPAPNTLSAPAEPAAPVTPPAPPASSAPRSPGAPNDNTQSPSSKKRRSGRHKASRK